MNVFIASNNVITPALIGLGGLAILFGGILAIASRIFAVNEDPRIEEIINMLPGANCGACGYPGCRGYAEALVKGEAPPDRCGPAGCAFVDKVSEMLGLTFSGAERNVALVHCKGAPDQAVRFEYNGVKTCHAASMTGGGFTGCEYGCLGFHDCFRACKYGALSIREDGLPVVNRDKCVACRACVTACPRKIIEMVPAKSEVHILCSNPLRGKAVKDVCVHGCIGCTRCVKACPVGAISMKDGLAMIDYSQCTNCGNCVKVCPVFVIHDYHDRHWLTWESTGEKSHEEETVSVSAS